MLATLEFSDGGVRLTLFATVMFTAALLASRNSTYLVDYYIVVVVLNRFVRRVLDWADGKYDDRPLSSLLPLAITALMAAVVLSKQSSFPRPLRISLGCLGASLGYAALIGASNGFAAFYSLLEYIAPLALLFYGIALRVDFLTVDRWVRTVAAAAVAVGVYGWYQWVVMPPWDAAWIEWSKMWTSMGHPEPFKSSVCSTLESRGPYAWFMATAAVPLLCAPRWRRSVGWAGAIFIVASILPSTVRSAFGILVVGVAGFAMARGGQSWLRSLLSLVIAIGGLMALKGALPESQRLYDRVETIGNFSADSSFQGRMGIAQHGIGIVASRPQGFGLGSSGLATAISGESGVIGDNGFLELIATFGLPGLALLMVGFAIIVREVIRINRLAPSEHAALGLAQLAAGTAAMAIANWLPGPYSGLAILPLGGVLGASLPRPTCHSASLRSTHIPTAIR